MTDIPPDMIAFADQRVAAAAQFLDRLSAGEIANLGETRDDPIATLSLSTALQTHLTSMGAVADALALAIRRLAWNQKDDPA